MKSEPAVLIGAIASIVVVVLSAFDIVLDVTVVETVLLAIVPLVTGLITRQKVTPVDSGL